MLSGLCFMPQIRLSGKDAEVKQTLLDIKRKTNVTTQAIAERARLSVADVFVVETGGFSSRETAQKVVTAFNQLSGMRVMVDDIKLYSRASSDDKGYRYFSAL